MPDTSSAELSHDGSKPIAEFRQHNVGSGSACGHHGEILQGVFERDGEFVRGLVTLPCNAFSSRVSVTLERDAELVVQPPWKTKTRDAVVNALDVLGAAPLYGGVVDVRSSIPVSRGFGSSTADVVAAIRAVGEALQCYLAPEDVAYIAVTSETACDPAMFNHCLLFAQRAGLVIEDFGVPLPPMQVVSFSLGSGNGIDTVDFTPAQYSAWEAEAFRVLLGLLRRGIHDSNIAQIGAVATASARINFRHLPFPELEVAQGLVRATNAVGLQVAHSGDVAGLLFPLSDPHIDVALERAASSGLHDVRMLTVGHRTLGADPRRPAARTKMRKPVARERERT